MRSILPLVIIYMLLVSAGSLAVFSRGRRLAQNPNWEAGHALPPNHRVIASDFRSPLFDIDSITLHLPDRARMVGHYTLRPVAANTPLKPADVASHPVIPEKPGVAPLFVAIPTEADALDAGSYIDVAGTALVAHKRVEAVWCAKNCFAIVYVNEQERKSVGAAPSALLRSAWGDPMQTTRWQPVKTMKVPAAAAGTWTLAVDNVPAATTLKFETIGRWHYSDSPAIQCGPDGDAGGPLTLKPLLDTTPIGAVIGKIGGSTAGRSDGTLFAVGTFAVVTTTTSGPLFLAMNIDPARPPKNQDEVTVTISEALP